MIVAKENPNQKKICLITCEGNFFMIGYEILHMSEMLSNIVLEFSNNEIETIEIPLGHITGKVIQKVIQFCEYHSNDPKDKLEETEFESTISICDWDKTFFGTDHQEIFSLLLAANFLNIPLLLDTGCKIVAKMIQGKEPEDIRKIFNIENDFTPEEQEEMKREYAWLRN